MVYAARAFAGLMAGNFGVASAMMADITPPDNRARGMGLIGAAFGLGMVLGPMIGGLLSGGDGSFTLPCIFAGVMSVLAIIAAARFLPESLSPEKRAANRAHQRSDDRLSLYGMLKATGNRLILSQYVLHNLCVSSVTYLFPLWMGDVLGWSAREVGIVFGIQGAIMVVVQGGLMGMLVRNVGELRLLCLSITAFFIGLLSAVFAETMLVMVGSMYLAMTGATLCMPLLNAIVSHRTPMEHRGRMLGTTSAASSWGRVIGPLMAGTNLAVFGYPGAWLGCSAFVVFYLAWALREYAHTILSTKEPPNHVH
jgi:MFS family permease